MSWVQFLAISVAAILAALAILWGKGRRRGETGISHVGIGGRLFPVERHNKNSFYRGGFGHEAVPNADGSARAVMRRKPWRLTIALWTFECDQGFFSQQDRDVPVSIENKDGDVLIGSANIESLHHIGRDLVLITLSGRRLEAV